MLYLDTRVKGTKINNTTGKAVVMKHKEYVTGVVTGVLAAALAAGGLNYVHQNQSGSVLADSAHVEKVEYLEKLIANKLCECKGKVVELKSENREFTATTLKEQISKPVKAVTVGELFEQIIRELQDERRTGYATSVEQVYRSLLKFNKHLSAYFSDIDHLWLKRYELWLRRQGRAENTIGVRFRTLRMVFNQAIERGYAKMEQYPFKSYKVGKLHAETPKRAISKTEVKAVMDFPCEGRGFYTRFAIDLFSFSYLMGGINFADMANLTRQNIVDGRLVYRRQKTGKLLNLPIHSRAMEIIESYASGNIYLFPIYSKEHKTIQQKLNRHHKVITKVNRALAEIGKELKIPIKLTTYVARHSYATVLKRAGVPTSIISESLGHSSERVTQIYLDSFENERMDEALRNLL